MGLKRHSGGRGRAGRQEAQMREGRAAGGESYRRRERHRRGRLQEGRATGRREPGRREERTDGRPAGSGDATLFNLKQVPHHWGVVGNIGVIPSSHFASAGGVLPPGGFGNDEMPFPGFGIFDIPRIQEPKT